jgi:small conductance mechanosensitive channel
MSQQWSRVILDVAVAYNADLEHASQVIGDVARAMTEDPDLGPLITDEPDLWGVERVEADQVMIRLAVKTLPLEQWRVARALRERLKAALDEAGIAPTSPAPITYSVEGSPPEPDR